MFNILLSFHLYNIIKEVNGGFMGLEVGKVNLEKYQNNWKEEFKKEKYNLEKIFREVALEIEHVGSTAIPGLSAKPIIDIALALNSLEDFDEFKYYYDNHEDYSIKDTREIGEILLRKGPESNRTHFIHIVKKDSDRYKNMVLFRDYLINNPEELKAYEDLKKELAIKFKDDRKSYTASKNEFITDIINKAKK